MTLGCDYSWGRPSPMALYQAGYRFACRYLTGGGKALDSQEAALLQLNGLAIVLNYEIAADPSNGVGDAQAALAAVNALGVPVDRPIYFSIDTGSDPDCAQYFSGVRSVCGDRTGAYGGDDTLRTAQSQGAKWFWRSNAWHNTPFQGAHIQQRLQQDFGGSIDVDDALQDDFGQWPAPAHSGGGGTFNVGDDELAWLVAGPPGTTAYVVRADLSSKQGVASLADWQGLQFLGYKQITLSPQQLKAIPTSG